MAIDFLSDEWDEIKAELKTMLDSEFRALENATNEKDADKSRGALRVIRRLLELEKKQSKAA